MSEQEMIQRFGEIVKMHNEGLKQSFKDKIDNMEGRIDNKLLTMRSDLMQTITDMFVTRKEFFDLFANQYRAIKKEERETMLSKTSLLRNIMNILQMVGTIGVAIVGYMLAKCLI